MERNTDDQGDDVELLLKDFDQWSSSYANNEELGERRLSLFIGVITATFGGIAFLIERADGDSPEIANWYFATAFVAFVLLLFGILTALRVFRRNKQTGHYLALLGGLRERLAPSWSRHVGKVFGKTEPRSIRNGGYVHVVALLNSTLCVIFAWSIAMAIESLHPYAPVIGLAFGALAATVQLELITRASKPKKASEFLRFGVGLIVADQSGRVLALERKGHKGAWQLPQGGVDEGEAPDDAAYRELREETGLEAKQVELVATHPVLLGYELPLAARSAKTGSGQVHRWYLFRLSDSGARPESKEESSQVAWKPFTELAASAVEFRRPVYAVLLRELWPKLDAPRR